VYEIYEKCSKCDSVIMKRIFQKGWEYHKCPKCGYGHKAHDFPGDKNAPFMKIKKEEKK